ncbi:hypothetical protein QCM8_202 [Bacillus phage QCM8]|nr:hypothetical protein QCM8_202 [Bacillus phage QCM8]
MITNKSIKIAPVDDGISVASLDDGFGDLKFDSTGTPLLIPSFVIPFKQKPQDEFSNGSKLEYLAVDINGQKWVVGNYAIKMGTNVDWIGGENKHLDKRFSILFKNSTS